MIEVFSSKRKDTRQEDTGVHALTVLTMQRNWKDAARPVTGSPVVEAEETEAKAPAYTWMQVLATVLLICVLHVCQWQWKAQGQ